MISDNFVALPLHKGQRYSKKDLISKIDLWKYILKYKCSAEAGESILIGMQILNIDYLAACFASSELSLKIVIIDYSRNDDFKDLTYYDPKTKILSPIDIFLHDFSKEEFAEHPKALSKFTFFSNCSKRTYSIYNDLDFTVNDPEQFNLAKDIFPDPTDTVMRCTSSGTTGTPKIVEHTHEFLYKVSVRNAEKFSGECLHVRNLNHGSSLAVYLLPTLISDNVSTHIFYDLGAKDTADSINDTEPFEIFIRDFKEFYNTLEYVIFPYPFMIDEFIDASIRNKIKWPRLNVQTLSYIQDKPKHAIADGVIKSITSIFGSNETSGPVFTAYIDRQNSNQDSSLFDTIDDFYGIKLYDTGLLGVTLPTYNIEIVTNDLFEQQGVFYKHKGRSDLVKINGEILDIKIVNELNSRNSNAYIVTDTVKNCLYLAFWDRPDDHITEEYFNFFQNNFNRIQIDKITVLNKNKFLTGIKIDNELLREYFRNYV
jgi:hypothetical protein